jgi:predicted LPLAT superfamily acyltransferase
MSTHWSNIQESGALLGMRLIFFIYRHLGKYICRIFLYPVIAYYFLSKKQARKASLDFLARVKEQKKLTHNPSLYYWSFKHFIQFGQGLIDKLAAWSNAINEATVSLHDFDAFIETSYKKMGSLIIVSHLGNQEVARVLAKQNNHIKLNILVHTTHSVRFNQLLNETNNNSQLNLISVTDISPATIIMLKTKLDAGESIVIAGDRTPINGIHQNTAFFLGAPALFPQGPYILASLLNCPVFLMFSIKSHLGYDVYFEKFADKISLDRKHRGQDISMWTQKFADRLGYYTLRSPLEWNNFYHFWDINPN